MKTNNKFKQLQCKLSAGIFDKIKNDAKNRRMSLGGYIENVFTDIDAFAENKAAVAVSDYMMMKKIEENEDRSFAYKQHSDTNGEFIEVRTSDGTLISKRRLDSLPKPWWKRIFA